MLCVFCLPYQSAWNKHCDFMNNYKSLVPLLFTRSWSPPVSYVLLNVYWLPWWSCKHIFSWSTSTPGSFNFYSIALIFQVHLVLLCVQRILLFVSIFYYRAEVIFEIFYSFSTEWFVRLAVHCILSIVLQHDISELLILHMFATTQLYIVAACFSW